MIGRRLLTVTVALPVLLVPLWFGGWAWLVFVVLLAAVGVHEAVGLFGRMELPATAGWALGAGGVALAAVAAVALGHLRPQVLGLGPFAALAVSLVAFLLAPGDSPFRAFAGVFAAAIYPAWLFAFLLLLRAGGHGLGLTFWLFAVVWVGDAAAYGAGSLIGGVRVVPGISPSKTLVGFVAGFILSLAVAFGLAPVAGLAAGEALALGALVAVAAQFGDLAESLLKRRAGVKDSGALLPGHGGILDRFDGVLLAAPVLYYCLTLLRP